MKSRHQSGASEGSERAAKLRLARLRVLILEREDENRWTPAPAHCLPPLFTKLEERPASPLARAVLRNEAARDTRWLAARSAKRREKARA